MDPAQSTLDLGEPTTPIICPYCHQRIAAKEIDGGETCTVDGKPMHRECEMDERMDAFEI